MFSLAHTDMKRFKPNPNAIKVRDLNFLLCSEIFMHYGSQLRASHLILNCTPSYTSYQDPRQALTVGLYYYILTPDIEAFSRDD